MEPRASTDVDQVSKELLIGETIMGATIIASKFVLPSVKALLKISHTPITQVQIKVAPIQYFHVQYKIS